MRLVMQTLTSMSALKKGLRETKSSQTERAPDEFVCYEKQVSNHDLVLAATITVLRACLVNFLVAGAQAKACAQ